MASFIVEDGSGVAGANSYNAQATADTYHLDHGNPSAWSTAEPAAKGYALVEASAYLDDVYHVRWAGVRGSQEQGLDWPRYSAIDFDGFLRPSDTVPEEIQRACSILALKVVSGDTLEPDLTAGSFGIKRERVKAAVIEEEKEYVSSKPSVKRYTEVQRALRPILKNRNRIERG